MDLLAFSHPNEQLFIMPVIHIIHVYEYMKSLSICFTLSHKAFVLHYCRQTRVDSLSCAVRFLAYKM